MGDKTGIEWTDSTWNPIRGCSRVSEGCRHCYAEEQALRIQGMDRGRGVPEGEGSYDGLLAPGGQWNGKVRVVPELLDQPLRWRRPRRIFVNSMSDLFHESVPDAVIDDIFQVMALSRHHTFQILTKRPERMLQYFRGLQEAADRHAAKVGTFTPADVINLRFLSRHPSTGQAVAPGDRAWPLPNVWLGVSAEDQETYDRRAQLLQLVPAAVRFLSLEPLLGRVKLWPRLGLSMVNGVDVDPLDWVIVGGESGREARPLHPDWVRSIRDECQEARVPLLFKQWGEWKPICEPGDWKDRLYTPNRVAGEGESQATLNDVYGETCTVPKAVVQLDGRALPVTSDQAWGPGAMTVFRVGKRKAGRLLDGVLHDSYPEVAHG